jgi:FAD/FMN-containing dehydrogenase/Fe-S oxidoreductase
MIPALVPPQSIDPTVARFGDVLLSLGFEGDISKDQASRCALATDNSIFQILPDLIVHPQNEKDVLKVMKTLGRPEFKTVAVTPRGGGTGTNGQALNHGVILDLSRYMDKLLEINAQEGWARVQPGVVLDQLNRELKAYGYFFSPAVSTSSRATIGGMVNNDSSGKGSLVYGKTSDHVISLHVALSDGSLLQTYPELDGTDLLGLCARQDRVGQIYRTVCAVLKNHQGEIEHVFPKMNRFMSGYNLQHALTPQGQLRLNYLLSGSEGTLGVTTEIKLKLTPIPKFSRMVAINYRNFDSALRCAQQLASTRPEAVESIDDKIMTMAREDAVWDRVKHLMESEANSEPVMAVNFVEYVGMNKAEVDASIESLIEKLKQNTYPGVISYIQADDPTDIAALWELRKKGVGLLGAVKGDRKPIAFVEDTAVPPEHLADYIAEFSQLLKSHHLDYGMFGHVDAGCMHVRPALDLTVPTDEALVKTISDQVCQLVLKYGGVMWGEHGRGIRSEYTPEFFGPVLYEQLRVIKGAFDPHNQMNPGKMVSPAGEADATYQIDQTSKRGHADREISKDVRVAWPSAMNCNGNGACHSVDPNDVMCPSSKITKNRIHSPKGRAGLLREWLRLSQKAGINVDTPEKPSLSNLFQRAMNTWKCRDRNQDFHHQVYDAMMGCLSCKACATQCPIKVDIPSMKARFMSVYHQRYLHPLKDYLVAGVEQMAPMMSPIAKPMNFLQNLSITKYLTKQVGMVDAPLLSSPTLEEGLKSRRMQVFDLEKINKIEPSTKARSVILVQDCFTSYYEADLVLAVVDLLQFLGVRVYVAPFMPNGKPMHIKGFLKSFHDVALANTQSLKTLEKTGLPLIGIEPSMALTYREEYVDILGKDSKVEVKLLQEWLAPFLAQQKALEDRVFNKTLKAKVFTLFGHCTEKTSAAASQRQWKEIYSRFGLHLELTATGCCGMAGTYGHETNHLQESRGIFAMSWEKKIAEAQQKNQKVLATGFSCRCQTKRFAGFKPQHPAVALLDALRP